MGKPITYEVNVTVTLTLTLTLITSEDGGREMRRMTREVAKAVAKYGNEAEAILFSDFLKMVKVEPWKTIFGITEGLPSSVWNKSTDPYPNPNPNPEWQVSVRKRLSSQLVKWRRKDGTLRPSLGG